MIKVESTTRRYGSLTAVDRVSFEVDKNEIVGFVGPNGAGKSTMLKMLSTFIHPTEGSITVAGHDAVSSPLAVRHNIGYLSGDTPLYQEMRVDKFLRFIAEARGLSGNEMEQSLAKTIHLCSLDSVLNALASSTVADLLRPRRIRLGLPARSPAAETRLTRFIIAGWAALLACFAMGCALWQTASGQTLIDFALGVMVFAYAGLLGVFATALLTKRGSPASAAAAMGVGLMLVVAMDPSVWPLWFGEHTPPLAFSWRMTVAATGAFVVCLSARPNTSRK